MISVKKRERKLKASTALYLDYRVGGKRFQEPTGLHIFPGKDEPTKQLNKENLIRFEFLRNEKERQLLDGIFALPVHRQKINFFQYYNEYFIKYPTKERRANAILKKLKEFYPNPTLPIAVIDESFLVKFKNFLEANLTGETPHNYFKMLGRVINQATKDKLFSVNPVSDISIKKMQGVPKEVLTMAEIEKLINYSCTNKEVKRAFIFCCFTGLRYCDVSRLKWENINGNVFSIVQSKTTKLVTSTLHPTAYKQLGKKKELTMPVFALPTSLNGCNKVLKEWVKRTGITKKITWHCARHSMATNLITYEADIVAVSSLMGHSNISSTQRYIKKSDEMRKTALAKLPVF